MRKIAVRFDDFNVDMVIEMEERNRELCDEVWNALPFKYVLEHAMVSGYSVYGWVPMISLAPVPFRLLRTEAPVGFVSFNQGTGNKISMKYGEISEDLPGTPLGYIPEPYHKDLARIGREIWFNYFGEKKIYTVSMRRIEGETQ